MDCIFLFLFFFFLNKSVFSNLRLERHNPANSKKREIFCQIFLLLQRYFYLVDCCRISINLVFLPSHGPETNLIVCRYEYNNPQINFIFVSSM